MLFRTGRKDHFNHEMFDLTQKGWRTVGAVTLGGAAIMAWFGVNEPFTQGAILRFVVYWGLFLLLLAATLFIVLLDLRYIRLQYVANERELLRQTLADESFRRELIAAQQRKNDTGSAGSQSD